MDYKSENPDIRTFKNRRVIYNTSIMPVLELICLPISPDQYFLFKKIITYLFILHGIVFAYSKMKLKI